MRRERFSGQPPQGRSRLRILLSGAAFIAVVLLFSLGLSHASTRTAMTGQQTLEDAVRRNVTLCYAMEGRYPDSIEYLKSAYGLSYDEDAYFVDYLSNGSNIIPDITVISRSE